MNDLQKQSESWQKKAEKLLADSNLIEELAQFGEVNTTGAFKHQLMMTPDIDLYITVEKPTKELAKKIINYLIDQNWWHNVLYSDWLNFRYETHQHLPKAYYICLKTSVELDRWKVDVWLLDPKQTKQFLEIFSLHKISPEQRTAILLLKNARNLKEITTGSYDLYDAVINHQVRSVEQFRRFQGTKNDRP